MGTFQHSAGGKVLIPLPSHIQGSAIFGGPNKEYRYQLKRVWDAKLPSILFVMMNPSTADPEFDDPTVAKCRKYATAWCYATLLVGNTFAYRATDQKQRLSVADPVGPENDINLIAMAHAADRVVYAYGNPHKKLRRHGNALARRLQEACSKPAHVLDLTKDGTPRHPLYLRDDTPPVAWVCGAS